MIKIFFFHIQCHVLSFFLFRPIAISSSNFQVLTGVGSSSTAFQITPSVICVSSVPSSGSTSKLVHITNQIGNLGASLNSGDGVTFSAIFRKSSDGSDIVISDCVVSADTAIVARGLGGYTCEVGNGRLSPDQYAVTIRHSGTVNNGTTDTTNSLNSIKPWHTALTLVVYEQPTAELSIGKEFLEQEVAGGDQIRLEHTGSGDPFAELPIANAKLRI